ncbi:MAG: group II intron reverse transcriptase/maturase [Myxococcales bacterium]|nr:group II intron reverse transcriptase/maturase [Myxococcales bacterium]
MKESYTEGLATHGDPESCATDCKAEGEALTGARTGSVLSREIRQSGAPTPLTEAEGNMTRGRQREPSVSPARSETRRTCGTSLHENREVLASLAADGAAGRAGKADGRTPAMYGARKSDKPVVPVKLPNKIVQAVAEAAEGRGLAKGNTDEQNATRTQRRTLAHNALDRVRQAAKGNKRMQFTALLHHVDIDRLRLAFSALKRDAAPGVDGVTWVEYARHLEDNLRDLRERLHRGAYRAKASRRVYIPKADGRPRPLGVASLEDKIVQRAVVEVLNAIYETDFLGFSYGFRPGRGPHDALDALAAGINRRKVNWVLDADIRGFFDSIDHGWLRKFVEHRIGDRRILRLIQKWLAAGVMENGDWRPSEVGSPQGATVSPLLANVYLHYVLDLWTQRWRTRQAHGDVVVVRYADDFIVGFQHRSDAERFLAELRERLAKFQLELHPDKTRLIAFGRFALPNHRQSGLPKKPETFNFLGFTHVCARSRNGNFLMRRQTERKRMVAKLHVISTELRRRLHHSIIDQGRWLHSVVRGYFAYYAVPSNGKMIGSFRTQVSRLWYRALRRRSQRRRLNWKTMSRLVARWLPPARILHPWPDKRFDVRTRGKSPVR